MPGLSNQTSRWLWPALYSAFLLGVALIGGWLASINLVDHADIDKAASLQLNDIAPIDNFSAVAEIEAPKVDTQTNVEAAPDDGVYEDSSISGDPANEAANATDQTVIQ